MANKAAHLAAAIAFGAFSLYLSRLGYQNLRGDEAYSVMVSKWDLSRTIGLVAAEDPHPPLYYALLHFWMKVTGDGEFAIRFLSVAFGVLAVATTFSLSLAFFRRLTPTLRGENGGAFDTESDKRPLLAALLAALFIAINLLLVWHSQDARSYTMLVFLTAASVCLGIGGLSSRRVWLGYLLVTYLAMLTHYSGFYVIIAENLGMLVLLAVGQKERLSRVLRWFAAQAILVAAYLPWVLLAIGPIQAHPSDWERPVSLATFAERALVALGAGTTVDAGSRVVVLFVVALVLLLAIVAGLRARLAGTKTGLTATAFYLIVPSLLLFTFSVWRPMFDERHLTIVLPAFAMTGAFGAAFLTQRAWVGTVAIGVLIGTVASLSLGNYFFNPAFNKSPDWRGMVTEIKRQEREGDYILLNFPDPVFGYYYRGATPSGMLSSSVPVNKPQTEWELAKLANRSCFSGSVSAHTNIGQL